MPGDLSHLLFGLLFELALFSRGILVLLVLGHLVIHIALCLHKLHLVHTFTHVLVQEGLVVTLLVAADGQVLTSR